MASPRRIALRLVNVSKRYSEIIALDKVSLEVWEGEYLCIIGPSGSGKSTLLKCIAGIVRPDEGDIYIWDRRVNDLPIEERGIGLVFQEILLFPHMTVRGNVVYPALVKLLPKGEEIARETLSLFNLEFRVSNLPEELSLGEQQKTAIARALASGTRILLMDEPYGSIDPRVAVELRREVRMLAKDLGLTIIHVTHNQEEAMAVADRVVVMRNGRIEQVGRPEDLYFRPRTLFVARFIGGENNFLEGKLIGREGDFLKIDVGYARILGRGNVSTGHVVATIRPEQIRIIDVGGVIEGVVRYREFLGRIYKYVIEPVEGQALIVKERRKVEVGSRVSLSFSPQNVIVFEYPPEGLEEAIRYE